MNRSMTAMRCALALAMAASPLAAQSSVRYQPTADTVRYVSVNSYFLYFVRGADTLGEPVSTRTEEARKATADSRGLSLWVRLRGLGGEPFEVAETYTVAPSGRMLAVGGRPVAEVSHARLDLLPRLPATASSLSAGETWSDTVATSGKEDFGMTAYEVTRQYSVHRLVDTLGTTVAHIVARGRMRVRQGGWNDEAKKEAWWQDVSGPVADTVLFDVRRGALMAATAVMRLTGTGGLTGAPPMASGLNSEVRLTLRQ